MHRETFNVARASYSGFLDSTSSREILLSRARLRGKKLAETVAPKQSRPGQYENLTWKQTPYTVSYLVILEIQARVFLSWGPSIAAGHPLTPLRTAVNNLFCMDQPRFTASKIVKYLVRSRLVDMNAKLHTN